VNDVAECGFTIGDVIHREHRQQTTAQRDSVRSSGEELIEGTALIGLKMRERDPA